MPSLLFADFLFAADSADATLTYSPPAVDIIVAACRC